jgi:hypothetical protein
MPTPSIGSQQGNKNLLGLLLVIIQEMLQEMLWQLQNSAGPSAKKSHTEAMGCATGDSQRLRVSSAASHGAQINSA